MDIIDIDIRLEEAVEEHYSISTIVTKQFYSAEQITVERTQFHTYRDIHHLFYLFQGFNLRIYDVSFIFIIVTRDFVEV